MSLNLNGNVTGIYLGSTKADAVYLGNVKVFESTPPQETVTIGGRAYPVVTIGSQKWIAENLDYKYSGLTVGPAGTSTTMKLANYYNNDEATYGVNGNKYGLLYNWSAVKYLNDNRSTLCPGWHVPSKSEWETLFEAVGGSEVAGTKLKSTEGWNSGNGDGSTAFSALPSGQRHIGSSEVYFGNKGSVAFIWTTTLYGTNARYHVSFYTSAGITIDEYNTKNQYSIRLVKDA